MPDNPTVVAIDWCKTLRPLYTDGTDWIGLDNGAYGWFITYIEPPNGPAHVRSVNIVRVDDNGQARFLIGVRT